MSADHQSPIHEAERDTRRRKIRALLAGGLVLGIGAAVTLAAWSDNVFGKAEFATEGWNIQGSFDGHAVWDEYATAATAGQFVFTIAPLALVPGETVHAPVSLRIGPAPSSLDGTVQLLGATGGDAVLTPALRYAVYSGVTKANCDAGNLVGGSAWVGTTAAPVALTAGSGTNVTLQGDGTPVDLCFAVTLPAGADPAVVSGVNTGQLLWQFTGQSS